MTQTTAPADIRADHPAPVRPPAGEPSRLAPRGRGPARARGVLTVLAWVWPAVPVVAWLATGGLSQAASSPAGLLTGAGILSGLVATAIVVEMLWLAARVPAGERVLGHDRALRIHASLGKPAFLGLVFHGLFVVAGYALADGLTWWGEFGQLWATNDAALAVVGLLLLAVVAASSVAMARARLPHEVWFGIHLLTYVAVAVSLPHQFTMGEVFASGLAAAGWLAVWVVTAFVVLTYRVFLPLFATLEHRLVVTAVTPVVRDTVAIDMSGRRLDRIGLEAGQFFTWRFLAPGLWWHGHPFSVSATPDGQRVRITIRRSGAGTDLIATRLRPGTPVLFAGPYGVFTERMRTTDRVVLVGVGSGIAPVLSLMGDLPVRPGAATAIVRAGSVEEIPHRAELHTLAATRGVRLIELVGSRRRHADGSASWLPEGARATSLRDLAPDLADADLYVCGPGPVREQVVGEALVAGLPPARIHAEAFAW